VEASAVVAVGIAGSVDVVVGCQSLPGAVALLVAALFVDIVVLAALPADPPQTRQP